MSEKTNVMSLGAARARDKEKNNSDNSVIDLYIDKVVNKGLNIYQNIEQTGGKEGENLKTHIINTVFVLESISKKIGLKKYKSLAYLILTIHDLNKTDNFKRMGYGEIVDDISIEKEILRLGLNEFMPDWKDFSEEIRILMLGHSGHHNLGGMFLVPKNDKPTLKVKDLEYFENIIQAADISDLSKDFNESHHKSTFCKKINTFVSKFNKENKRFTLINHRVSEQRGVFTNIIHTTVAGYLYKKYEADIVFMYPEGNYYLVSSDHDLIINESDKLEIGLQVKDNINNFKKSEYEEFIGKDQKQGIKVAPDVLELATTNEIFLVIRNLISKKTYKISEREKECKLKLSKNIDKLSQEDQNKINILIDKDNIFPTTNDGMQLAEFVRSFYIFIKEYLSKELAKIDKRYKDVWNYIYDILDFPKDKIDLYSVSDPLYQRAYFVASDIENSFDDLMNLFINKIDSFKTDQPTEIIENSNIVDYVKSNIFFNFESVDNSIFENNFSNYVKNNHKQCSSCSSAFKADSMMAADVPDGIKVQLFSNRLKGGPNKPKRNICPICKAQFNIEKLVYPNNTGEKPLYLHLMPYSFFSNSLIKSYKSMFTELMSLGNVIEFDIEDILKEYKDNNKLEIKVSESKVNGLYLPTKTEGVVANIITLPVNYKGQNNIYKYLQAIEFALLFSKIFNFKIIITESQIPILTKQDFDCLYIDGLPSVLINYLRTKESQENNTSVNNFTYKEMNKFWERYLIIKKISKILKTKDNPYQDIVVSLIKGDKYIFSTIDKFIERKAGDKGGLIMNLTRELYPEIEKLINSY